MACFIEHQKSVDHETKLSNLRETAKRLKQIYHLGDNKDDDGMDESREYKTEKIRRHRRSRSYDHDPLRNISNDDFSQSSYRDGVKSPMSDVFPTARARRRMPHAACESCGSCGRYATLSRNSSIDVNLPASPPPPTAVSSPRYVTVAFSPEPSTHSRESYDLWSTEDQEKVKLLIKSKGRHLQKQTSTTSFNASQNCEEYKEGYRKSPGVSSPCDSESDGTADIVESKPVYVTKKELKLALPESSSKMKCISFNSTQSAFDRPFPKNSDANLFPTLEHYQLSDAIKPGDDHRYPSHYRFSSPSPQQDDFVNRSLEEDRILSPTTTYDSGLEVNFDGAVTCDGTSSSQEGTLRTTDGHSELMFDSDDFSDNITVIGKDMRGDRTDDTISICSTIRSDGVRKVLSTSTKGKGSYHPSTSSIVSGDHRRQSVDEFVGTWHQKNFCNDRVMVNVTVDVPESWEGSPDTSETAAGVGGICGDRHHKKRSSKKRYHKNKSSSSSSLKDRVKVNLIVDLRDLRRFTEEVSSESEEEVLLNEKHQFKILKPLETVPIFYQESNTVPLTTTKGVRRSISSRVEKQRMVPSWTHHSNAFKSYKVKEKKSKNINSFSKGSRRKTDNVLDISEIVAATNESIPPESLFEPREINTSVDAAAVTLKPVQSLVSSDTDRIKIELGDLSLDNEPLRINEIDLIQETQLQKKVLVAQDSTDSQSSPDSDRPKVGRIIYTEASEVDSDCVSLSAVDVVVEKEPVSCQVSEKIIYGEEGMPEMINHTKDGMLINSKGIPSVCQSISIPKLEDGSAKKEVTGNQMQKITQVSTDNFMAPDLTITGEVDDIHLKGESEKLEMVIEETVQECIVSCELQSSLEKDVDDLNLSISFSMDPSLLPKGDEQDQRGSPMIPLPRQLIIPTVKIDDFDSDQLFLEGLVPLVRSCVVSLSL